MEYEFRWSFRLQIVVYTIISLAAAVLTDLFLLMLCIRIGFMTIPGETQYAVSLNGSDPALAIQSLSDADAAGPVRNMAGSGTNGAGVLLGEGNVFYRMFGVGIRWQLIAILTAVGFLVFVLVFFCLSRQMSRYITQIVSGTALMAEGDFSQRLPLRKDDEFSCIAMQINKLADSVCAMEEKARQAQITKNDLITNVAHDLRTPLTSVMGYIDLASRSQSEVDRDKYLTLAMEKSRKLFRLIEELFAFTRTSYGQEPLALCRLDLTSLLEQEIEEIWPVFEENGLVCSFHCEQRPVMIDADGEQLVRVFENLLSNAVRYGRDGKQIHVTVRENASNVQVQVINYGSIIPRESLPYLFEKFYKVDKSRGAGQGGTGLGLSIAKAIVERHGGTISADSSPDGTVFTVSLPLPPSDQPAGGSKEDRAEAEGEES